MVGLLIIHFVKAIMNNYPTLHEINMLVFFTFMSITFVTRHVEALYFFIAGIGYALINSLFLWITWLGRFSGNANFFYFQVLALHSFIVLLFI